MSDARITHLFVDIGGVLLTNGWDRALRRRVAEHFGVDPAEMDERHHLTYDTYETGKMSLETYMGRVMFFEPRSFTLEQVTDFILKQAKPFPEMIEMVRRLKAAYGLKVAVVSNEGRELTVDRIRRFRLHEFVDFFIVSSFVHFRKPDLDIYRVALDTAQAVPGQVAYIEDRRMFSEVASTLGIRPVWHTGYESTKAALGEMGLTV